MEISICKFLLVAVLVQCVQLGSAYYYYSCDYPGDLAYGTITPHEQSYAVGATVDFACNKGYYLVGQAWTVCTYSSRTRSANWVHPAPVCKRKGEFICMGVFSVALISYRTMHNPTP
jgi:hypothetical protein